MIRRLLTLAQDDADAVVVGTICVRHVGESFQVELKHTIRSRWETDELVIAITICQRRCHERPIGAEKKESNIGKGNVTHIIIVRVFKNSS